MVIDYIVVGAGVVGSSTALALKRRGLQVKLIEQFYAGHSRGSSHGPSRIIRYFYEHERYQRFIPPAYRLWQQLEDEERVKLFTKCGILNVAGTADRQSLFTHILSSNDRDYSVHTAEQLAQKYPLKCGGDETAVIEHDGGILDANLCVQTIISRFQKLGGDFVTSVKISGMEKIDCGFKLKSTCGREFTTKKLILCCGAWMKTLLLDFGLDLPLSPIRVEVPYWKIKDSHKGQYDIDRFPAGSGLYDHADDKGDNIDYYWTPVKEYDNLIKIAPHGTSGGTISPDARDDISKQNPEAYEKLMKDLRKRIKNMFPGVETESGPAIIETCIYTNTPDLDFILDKHPKYRDMVIGCGFSGHGFKMAPEVGEILADMAMDKQPKYDMTPFSIDRFNC